MNVVKTTVIIFFVLNIFSCGAKYKDTTIKKYIIPDSIFQFFPSKQQHNLKLIFTSDNAEKIDAKYFSTEFVITYICEVYQFKDLNETRKIESIYQSISLNTINISDSNYFVIGSERDLCARFDSLMLKKSYSKFHSNLNLVPNFGEMIDLSSLLLNSTALSDLNYEYKLYILKSGNKFILPEKYKTEWNLLPCQIKHGYQSGVAINYNLRNLIYWTMAW